MYCRNSLFELLGMVSLNKLPLAVRWFYRQMSGNDKNLKKLEKRCWHSEMWVLLYASRLRERRAERASSGYNWIRTLRMRGFEKSSKKLEKSSWQRVWKVVIYLSCAKRRAPCKLNNVMNTKHQILDSLSRSSKAWSGTTLNFFEAMIMVSIIWFEQRKLFRYHFIESLILAQDERWRRA